MLSLDSLSSYANIKKDISLMENIFEIFLSLLKNFEGPTLAFKNLIELMCRIIIKYRDL